MGVPIETWRARIGSFNVHALRQSVGICLQPSNLKVLSFIFFCVSYLLIIGNVELNPGPAFKCYVCSKEFQSLRSVSLHLKIHAVHKNFMFKCVGPTCHQIFATFRGLAGHLLATHEESTNRNVLSNPCHSALQKVKDGEIVQCPLKHECESEVVYDGSQQTSLSRLRVHLARDHPGWNKQDVSDETEQLEMPAEMLCEEFDAESSFGPPEDDPMMAASSNESVYDTESIVDYIARFYLELQTKCNLPVSTVDHISQCVSSLSEILLEQTQHLVDSELEAVGISQETRLNVRNRIALNDVLYCSHHKHSPGPTLSTDCLREAYAKKKLFLTYPSEISIDNDPFSDNVVHHVSISETLERLFQDSSVCKFIDDSFVKQKQRNNSVIQDFTDGLVFQDRTDFMEDTIVLILFQDAFNLANPLGSAKNFYKFLGVYFTLGNFPPYIRSKLDGMFLSLLANYNLISEEGFSYEDILTPVLNEIKSLTSNGINYHGKVLKVKLAYVAGDSLGSHGIGGFVESFTANYFCRYCEVTRNEFKSDPVVQGPTRTERQYNQTVAKLNLKRAGGMNVNNINGIKHNSCFNKIPGFHVCKPALPPCLGHDLFEGVVTWDLAEIISKLVDKKWFSYKELQRRIRRFHYSGSDSCNKPSRAVRDKESLRGHAIQNWTLLRLLPLILEGKIKDPSDKVWKLYLQLKCIVELACALQLREEDLTEMETLIEMYLKERHGFLSSAKPKHHYLRHYPWLFRLFGPLIYLWTMRFEAKHKFFKNICRAANNFINLGHTLAHRHQLFLSYLFAGQFFKVGILHFKPPTMKDEEMFKDQNLNTFITQESLQYQNFLKSANINDINYKLGHYVLLQAHEKAIKIGKITGIFLWGSTVKLIMEISWASYWDDFGLYKLSPVPSGYEVILQSDLKYPMPHAVYEFLDNLCLSLKFRLI